MSVYKRGNIWWVRFQFGGEEIRRSSKSRDRRSAERLERELRQECERVYRGGKQRRTFDVLIERFIAEHLPTVKPTSRRRYLMSLKALVPHFEGKYLDEIGRKQISDFITGRQKLVSGSSVRRDLACLSVAFNRGIGWDYIDRNPVKLVDRRHIKENKARTRYLSKDEYTRLLAHAGGYLRPMIAFAVETGLRLEEQLSMEWNQVRWDRNEIVIPRTKSGTPRTVPLTAEARQVLDLQPRHIRSSYVWVKKDGSRYGKLTRGLAGAARRAKIKDLRWHDLRRTCGSWMLQDGVSIEVVSKWLGHGSIAVTERSYAFLRTEDLHAAAQGRHKNRTGHAD